MAIHLSFFKEEREIRFFRRLLLNIEYDLGLSPLVCLNKLEAMEGDGLHIGASDVAGRVKFFSWGDRFQHEEIAFNAGSDYELIRLATPRLPTFPLR